MNRTGWEVAGVEYRFRPPTRRPEDNGAPAPRYRHGTADGMIIERDVAVHVRGGVTVYADVFRPADERPAPPLIAWSPYGKHAGSQVTERYPDGGVAPGQLSGYAAFESPDPWSIAATNPPHLAAINPWEGWSDTYREVARHGGIPETYFWPYIGQRWGCGTQLVEDLAAETAGHPLFDGFWASKAADLARITAPAFVVASWSDQGLHTRGTFEGFKIQPSRPRKQLTFHWPLPDPMVPAPMATGHRRLGER